MHFCPETVEAGPMHEKAKSNDLAGNYMCFIDIGLVYFHPSPEMMHGAAIACLVKLAMIGRGHGGSIAASWWRCLGMYVRGRGRGRRLGKGCCFCEELYLRIDS